MTAHLYYVGPVAAVWRDARRCPPPPEWIGLIDTESMGMRVAWYRGPDEWMIADADPQRPLTRVTTPLRWLDLSEEVNHE